MSNTQYIISKLDNKKYCKINGQFTRHLNQYNLTYQDYYEKYITEQSPKCSCGKSLTFYQKNYTYANSCGNPVCVGKTISNTKQAWTNKQRQQDSKNKKKAAINRTKEQIQEQLKKCKDTNRKKYGVDWAAQSEQFKNKSKQTKLARYGNEYYANWKASAEKNKNKTLSEQNTINNKRRKTNLERFGVECSFMRSGILAKSNKGNASIKDYAMPSGRIVGIRGYENIVLDKLLKTYNETDVLIHNNYSQIEVPIFQYISVNRRKLKYYPDIFIPKENKIIEVKSMWWWNAIGRKGYKGRIINNLKKRQAVLDKGHTYEVWLFETRKKYNILKNNEDFSQWVN